MEERLPSEGFSFKVTTLDPFSSAVIRVSKLVQIKTRPAPSSSASTRVNTQNTSKSPLQHCLCNSPFPPSIPSTATAARNQQQANKGVGGSNRASTGYEHLAFKHTGLLPYIYSSSSTHCLATMVHSPSIEAAHVQVAPLKELTNQALSNALVSPRSTNTWQAHQTETHVYTSHSSVRRFRKGRYV